MLLNFSIPQWECANPSEDAHNIIAYPYWDILLQFIERVDILQGHKEIVGQDNNRYKQPAKPIQHHIAIDVHKDHHWHRRW